MTAITNTGCFPMRWLIGVGYMTAGLLAGSALWLVSVFVLWPLAMWAVVYGSLLAMAIWLVGAAIYVLRTHRKARAPDRACSSRAQVSCPSSMASSCSPLWHQRDAYSLVRCQVRAPDRIAATEE